MNRGLWVVVLALCMIGSVAADGNLSLLATNMIPGGGNYVLDCGPVAIHDSVVNDLPAGDLQGSQYCIMSKSGQITIGTWVPWKNGETIGEPVADVVALYKQYDPHLTAASFPTDLKTLCDETYNAQLDLTNPQFQPCKTISSQYAGGTLYIYMYHDIDASAVFFLITDMKISTRAPSVLDNIVNFFKGLFGITTPGPAFISAPAFTQFHHAYFARQDDKQVIATWGDEDDQDTVSILYQNFVTNFSNILPNDTYLPQYQLGESNKQRIMLRLAAPDDVNLWRQYTSGLRITTVDGTKPTDVCGNGYIGFDEDCDGNDHLNGQSCDSLGKIGDTTHKLQCTSDCKFDTSQCLQCGPTLACKSTETCTNGQCVVKPCYDGKQDGDETDVDCGGSCVKDGKTCANDQSCKIDADCVSGNCVSNKCVATKPFICDYNGQPDVGEDPTCRDVLTPTTSCPTALNNIQTQGQYDISTRADLANKPQIFVKGTDSCKLQTTSGLVTEIAKGIDAQEITLYKDSYGTVNLSVIDGEWHIKGLQTAINSNFQTCWGTTVNQPFDIAVKINDVASCTPVQCVASGNSCALDSDCCSGTYEAWCSAGTCQRDYVPKCDTVTDTLCRDQLLTVVP